MTDFLLEFEVVKVGFFSDSVFHGTEIVKAEDLSSAYKEQITKANNLSDYPTMVTVKSIKPL